MSPDSPGASRSTLVIGYGNTLRRDDGAGFRAAEAVEAWHRPGLSVCAVHQLMPELAEELALAQRAIFIDARLALEGDRVEVRPIGPRASGSVTGHTGDPAFLLELTRVFHGRCPASWLITVPAVDTEMGEELSPTARQGVADALEAIAQLLDSEPPGA